MAAALVSATACSSSDDDDDTDTGDTTTIDGGDTDGDGTDGGDGGDGTDGGDGGDGTDGGDGGDGTDGGDGLAGAGTDGALSQPGSFQVTFTNMTLNQPMTPPVVAIHDPSVHLFQVGEESSDAIQVIAEMGNNDPLVDFANANPELVSAAGVAAPDPAGPIAAGGSSTINLTTEAEGHVFSAVNMIICTNDGISGVDSTALPSGTDPVVIMALPYDAGTRVNQNNSYSFFPPPCRAGADGEVPVVEAPLEDPRGVIGPHAGQSATINTPDGRNWDFATGDQVLMIEIVRN